MIDLLTHCTDTAALREALEAEGLERIPLCKTPTVRGDSGETLALVRVADPAEIERWPCLHVLGTYDEVFADPEKLAIYDRIYPRTPVAWVDEDGTEHTYTPPDKFGVFA